MRSSLYLVFFLILAQGLKAQTRNVSTIYISSASYSSNGEELPFWLKANQNGVFNTSGNRTQLIRTGISKNLDSLSSKVWDFTFGTELVGGYSGKTYFQPNQYWIGTRFHWIVLKVGAEADPIRFGGLSSTNGNMDASNNARPVPKITLTTKGYISFGFLPKWISYKALYEEGILWDNSYVQDARLHHKNVYFRVTLPAKWSFYAGLDHYVFWGGTSPDYGKLPTWSQYSRYILGQSGGEGAAMNDQQYVAGNQLGLYNLEIMKNFSSGSFSFYWNHLFEDKSGMKLSNLPDGLWGIHFKYGDRKRLVNELVYEWMYTKNQSGVDNMVPSPTPEDPYRMVSLDGDDKYFNHFVYSSGYTHYGQMMGTPLFVPIIDSNGMSHGFRSSRMWMHHLGLKGWLNSSLSWKTMLTYSKNFGEHHTPFPSPQSEFSFLAEMIYHFPNLPLQLMAAFAGDAGDRFEKRYGGSLGIKWLIK